MHLGVRMPRRARRLVHWSDAVCFDPDTARCYRMNRALVAVYRRCDGRTPISRVVDALEAQGLSSTDARQVISASLAILSEHVLLETSGRWPPLRGGLPPAWLPAICVRDVTRRDMDGISDPAPSIA